MKLRPHQQRMVDICTEILNGCPITEIIVAVTPGGGKSKLPVILAEMLIPAFADKLVWIAPRNNLKYQGEQEFLDHLVPTIKRLRATNGNEPDPCRGTDGYITTYQAVGLSHENHATYCKKYRTIVFLDEEHHVGDDSQWAPAIAAIRQNAVLTVTASGTLSRGDGLKIHGIEYDGEYVDLKETENRRVITYTRNQALKDKAILPIHFTHIDGAAEWRDEQGESRRSLTLAGNEYAKAALFTALRTGYAYDLLDATIKSWAEYKQCYNKAKLLVVAPSIEYAILYKTYLLKKRIESLIATSEDNTSAGIAIDRFKGKASPSSDVLVTCQMAYEGLSVPEITHIACLTHIRSIPWLEQCFARANRTAPGKGAGFIFGPMDDRFRDAIRAIETEQTQTLKEQAEAEGRAGAPQEEHDGPSISRPWITPIGSAAHLPEGFEIVPPAERPDGGLTPRQAEKVLRDEIAKHIEIVLSGTRAGSRAAMTRIVHETLKRAVGGKGRAWCNVEELAKQWAILKERWPV